ncbi:MAG: sugar phosphate isomerase/epimerase [Anaerolineae bacterium]|jgi:sugar phosphate isomerase/epimerase|nr:sugar phosphate isomerase/epimerase [Anaerolineae bacterium]
MTNEIHYSVFTKPWKTIDLARLGAFVNGLGFDGIELPVRPGYQVEPEAVANLPEAARTLGEFGVSIYSIAGPTDEATIAACAEAGVPVIRVMAPVDYGEPYLAAEARYRRAYDALIPLLDKYGVQLGVQNHNGRFVANAVGLKRLVEGYDPRHIGIVWDAAHEALNGMDVDLALDAAWSHLCMVNLKNAYWRRTSGPEAELATWQVYWTTGPQGRASWPRVAGELQVRGYAGVVCLTAEYSDEGAVDRLIAQDIAFAKGLFA